jgi:hypothetical protein
MLGAAAWALTTLDPQTIEYARLWMEYYRLSLVYLHPEVLLAIGTAAVLSAILVMLGISLGLSFNRPQS